MRGNISKSVSLKGDIGPQGPQGERGIQGPQGERGTQGEKGDTPNVTFRYDEDTGNLYYSTDGILMSSDVYPTQRFFVSAEIKDKTLIIKQGV